MLILAKCKRFDLLEFRLCLLRSTCMCVKSIYIAFSVICTE